MRLRVLVFMAAIAYALVIGGGLLLYRVHVVIPELRKSTIINHQDKLKAIHASYLDDLRNLKVLNVDWAAWNDTFHYIHGENDDFLTENILPYAFDDLDIDFIAIIGRDRKARFIGLKTDEGIIQLDELSKATEDLSLSYLLEAQQRSGTLRIAGEIGYYTSYAVTDNFQTKPSNGLLLFARVFPENLIQRIKLMTQTDIKPLDYRSLPESQLESNPIIRPMNGFAITRLSKDYFLLLDKPDNTFQTALKVSHDSIDIPFILDETTMFSILAFLALPIVVTFIAWLVFLRPVNTLFLQLKAMESRSRFVHIKTNTQIVEFRGFVNTFNKLVDKVHAYQEKLKQESQTDGLTGIRNRQYLDEQIENIWRTSIRQSLPLALIMIDIDFFKKYNDLYGHQRGDETLKFVARAINGLARRSDDIVARYGGEEFIFVSRPANQEELIEQLESIMAAVRDLDIEHDDSNITNHITVSCGACFTFEPKVEWHDNIKDVIKTADEALYEAKDNGRNRYVIRPFNGPRSTG